FPIFLRMRAGGSGINGVSPREVPMPDGPLLRALHALTGADATPDAELLRRFAAVRDDTAFELLVRRHADLVWKVCRGVLRDDPHAAEDAFQAAFLALARSAHSVGGESVPGWLYRVARNAALRARRTASRTPGPLPDAIAASHPAPDDAAASGELAALLTEEVGRLAAKFREPVLLCYFEGHTHAEAAERLGWAVGTVASRIARARDRLRHQLARRGVALSAAGLTVALSPPAPAVPPGLVRSCVLVAAGKSPATAPVLTLTEGVLSMMRTAKLKATAAAVALLAGLAGGGTLLAVAGGTEPPPAAKAPDAPKAGKPAHSPLRGTWTTTVVENHTIGGKPQPPKERTVKVVITDDRITYLDEDGFVDERMNSTYTLDPSAKPAAIDIASPKVGTALGIYRLDGDRLRLCFGPEPDKRPTAIPAAADGHPPGVTVTDLKRVDPDPATVRQRYPNAPGCFWMVEPRNPPRSLSTTGLVLMFDREADGAAVVTIAAAAANDRPCPEYRPVLFDADDKRYLPASGGGGMAGSRRDGALVSLYRWRMDPKVLPADKVALLGIEQLTAETHRTAARGAFERARKQGVAVLPYPEVGKPFEFAVTTADGKMASSRDWRGRVVLIDWWATWCNPCMAMQPELKKHYRKWHADGLEVLGVNLDRDPESGKKAAERLDLGWPQVYVPDDVTRDLWLTAVGTESIPLVLLIDRKGVLRAVDPPDLKQELQKLLKEEK
ncbi:MAG TPA: sigma-70 family RNA polymerase sigma factor, partial [Fimbriiglobus sp.]|nr:sigma-70 family RNA polymerase sigma factor [Fimbriiglobus sp.]